MRRREVELGVALAAAPFVVLSYNIVFHRSPVGQHPLNIETNFLLNTLIFWPIIEELIFRGVIQDFIALTTSKKFLFGRVSLANLLTSILFVSMHLIHHSPLWATLVFFPSLIFGYFKETYKTIFVPIFLHIFYNVSNLFLIL